jgi:glutathione peroxidase
MFRMLALCTALAAAPAAAAPGFTFDSIDGGPLDMDAWKGQPVLVVNTASRCGFTGQYDALQALYDKYQEAGLVVLAVPSNDFRQELSSAEAVKEFCEVNFGLTLPMTDITPVRGREAHPFYRWLRDTHGFQPSWNFNKVLIGPEGELVGTWGSTTRPLSAPITRAIAPYLAN